jgi:hypothetical protein
VDSDLSSAFTLAKEATLVLGHLYLCGKCDRHHGNLAGGVLISSDGLALTNYHVLDFREAVVFGAMTAAGEVYAIDEVLAASKSDDVALIRLRGAKDLAHLPLGTELKTGEALFVVSHPDGHFYTLTHGYLARRYLTPKERVPRLQITADFAKGSSGCGILNRRGELVGLVASTSSIYYNESPNGRESRSAGRIDRQTIANSPERRERSDRPLIPDDLGGLSGIEHLKPVGWQVRDPRLTTASPPRARGPP